MNEDFCNRLNLLIGEKRGGKTALATATGLSPQAITAMSKGRSNPSPQTIKSIARHYRVNEEWLAYGTGEKEAKYEVVEIYGPETKKVEQDPLTEFLLDISSKLTKSGRAKLTKLAAQLLIDEQTKEE